VNETPIMFSGLEAQGKMNRMEELFGGPERIYRSEPRGRGYYGTLRVFAEHEVESPVCADLECERVLEPDITPR
jgi:hypothetical protein